MNHENVMSFVKFYLAMLNIPKIQKLQGLEVCELAGLRTPDMG